MSPLPSTRILLSGLCALLLTATSLSCASDDPDYLFDFDGDGWSDSTNCGPEDPDTYPGADESCGDGIDNNCDGEVDEDCWVQLATGLLECWGLNDFGQTSAPQ